MGTPSWHDTLAHYNPLHFRKGHTSPPILSRDFAYANSAPVELAHPMREERDSVKGSSAKLFAELLSGPTVDIYVGKDRRHWSLHQNLLCHHSSYFETEFQGHEVPKGHAGKNERNGSTSNRLELLDDDPQGFELLVKWLYQGQLDDMSELDTDEEKYEYAVACHKLYALCDRFDMLRLKNIAIDLYRRGLNEAQLVPDADEIDEIYRASPPGSPFRQLMTKIAARQIMDPEVDKDAETYRKCFEDNTDFAVEMVNAIRYMSGGMLFDDPTETIDPCEYHDHRDGANCHIKGKGNLKPKPMVNGIGHAQPVAARKQLPAELSAERRTPRKLNVDATPATPLPRALAHRLAEPPVHKASPLQANGVPHDQAKSVSNGPRKLAFGSPAKQRAASAALATPPAMLNGIGSRPASLDEASSFGDGPKKLVNGSVKPAQGVLGKRRALDKLEEQVRSGADLGLKDGHVNGVIQQLNGVNHASGDEAVPNRKKAPLKLRRGSGLSGA